MKEFKYTSDLSNKYNTNDNFSEIEKISNLEDNIELMNYISKSKSL